jgi:hypothetical protein
MRTTFPLTIAATLLAASPALAQGTNTVGAAGGSDVTSTTGTNDASAAAGSGLGTPTADTSVGATAPTNGLTAGPGAAPGTSEPGAVDMAYGEPAQRDDDGFPWGLLGLLGLAGLIPRKRKHHSTDQQRTAR